MTTKTLTVNYVFLLIVLILEHLCSQAWSLHVHCVPWMAAFCMYTLKMMNLVPFVLEHISYVQQMYVGTTICSNPVYRVRVARYCFCQTTFSLRKWEFIISGYAVWTRISVTNCSLHIYVKFGTHLYKKRRNDLELESPLVFLALFL